jgi:hypothetical protein
MNSETVLTTVESTSSAKSTTEDEATSPAVMEHTKQRWQPLPCKMFQNNKCQTRTARRT